MNIIYVDGTFDLLHIGHIDFFKSIKKKSDILIVGVINDINVKSYKRLPIHDLKHRAEMLRNIKIVDMVIEDCPFNGISIEFINKYKINKIYYGGSSNTWNDHYRVPINLGIMNYIDYISPHISTSKIIEKIKKEY